MGLYEESRGLVVTGKAHRPMHKDSNGALQYKPDLLNVYFHVNERCIRRIFRIVYIYFIVYIYIYYKLYIKNYKQ